MGGGCGQCDAAIANAISTTSSVFQACIASAVPADSSVAREVESYCTREGNIALSHMGAGEARLRSAQTGSLLPPLLRGKSPCLRAASAGGRPQGPGQGAGGEAEG